jgi:hypothetical protein
MKFKIAHATQSRLQIVCASPLGDVQTVCMRWAQTPSLPQPVPSPQKTVGDKTDFRVSETRLGYEGLSANIGSIPETRSERPQKIRGPANTLPKTCQMFHPCGSYAERGSQGNLSRRAVATAQSCLLCIADIWMYAMRKCYAEAFIPIPIQ